MKTCNKCGVDKPLDEFYRNTSSKSGYSASCKECVKKRSRDRERGPKRDEILRKKRQYYQENREDFSIKSKAYRESNKQAIAERDRRYYEQNYEKLREYRKEYYERNREKIREQQREYYALNFDKIQACYEENRERIREYRKQYYRDNVEKFRERNRLAREAKAVWHQARYVEKRDEILSRSREYRKNNLGRYAAYARERQARKRSLPSELVAIRDVALRDGPWCWLCGDELSDWDSSHMDHLIPIKADPEHLGVWGVENPGTVLANMSLACPPCNIRKSNRILPCAIARYLRNSMPLATSA